MTLKSHSKFEEKLTCGLENDMRSSANFHQNIWKCQNWDFDVILLSKVENAWAKKLQWNYVQLHRRMRKNLKRSWLVVSKLTWEIWQILTHALKSLKKSHFNRLLLTKVYNVWAKKVPTRYLSWHPKSDAKFEEKLTCGLKHDMRNLSNFHQGSLKIGTVIGSF